MRAIDDDLSAAGLPPLARSAWVEVDIAKLTANAESLARFTKPANLAPVVKADGYGHGLEMAARCAVAGGAEWLCVADAAEAVRLRNDGFAGRVFVLYPVPPAMWPEMVAHGIDVTVGSLTETDVMTGTDLNGNLRVHLEIDTGMTRGGVQPEDALEAGRVLSEGAGTELTGVWTHLAAPEDPEILATQLDEFSAVVDRMRDESLVVGMVHAAASGGLLAAEVSSHDLVRPGLAYYGLHPEAGGPLPANCSPALTVRAHPVRVETVSPGTRVGYGGTWTAPATATIATLPIGYADGWSRSSSPGTSVLVDGRRAPVVGRVSSDSLTVDVTDLTNVSTDTLFTLLGEDGSEVITAEEVAAARGTISWEVLQQLGSRLTRVYRAGHRVVASRGESTLAVDISDSDAVPRY